MHKQDEAITLPNPRLLAATYFGLLSILFTFILHAFLHDGLGIKQLLPVFQAILLAVPVSAVFGALFGEKIVHAQHHYLRQSFLWAFVMTIVAIPVYDIGFVYLYYVNNLNLFMSSTFMQMVQLYLFVVLDSYILIGLWLVLLSGLAAMYLRGVLVYHILRSLDDKK